MKVTKVKVSNGGILLSNGTGTFGIKEDYNALSCGIFTTYPIEKKKYKVSFTYIGQKFEYQMACTIAGSTSNFVGPKTENDPVAREE